MRPTGKAVVRTSSIPAPVGGLNARDSIAAMKETDAVVMDNWFPELTGIRVRNGYGKWATGLPSTVETLMVYSNGSTRHLFGASGTAFYDCTAAGEVGAPAVSGLTNARWQYVNFGTTGGQFLLAVNGADKLRGYNGSTWWADGDGTHDITGVDTSLLSNINVFKNRVWFIESNSMRAWYLGLSSIAGAASSIDLSPLFKLGGYLIQMVTWTVDNAASIDDYAAFVSSEGEVALYKGTDPTNPDTWELVGMFRLGRPVGKRSFVKVGSDVVMVCADGFFPLSKALLTDRSQSQAAVSNKIVGLANSDISAYSGNFGWQIHLHPIGNKLIVNVPASSATYQYVMNTITGSWCRFTGWAASCFESMGDMLMFGADGFVAWADQGSTDDGAAISTDLVPAFSHFRSTLNKRFTMVRPVIQCDGRLNLLIDLCTDFTVSPAQSTPNLSRGGSAPWNVSSWNLSGWAYGMMVRKDWQSVFGIGIAATLRLRTSTVNQTVVLQSIDYVFEQGGIL